MNRLGNDVLAFGLKAPECERFIKWCDRHPEGYIANGNIPYARVMMHAADCVWGRGKSWGDPTKTNIKLTSLEEDLLLLTVEAEWPDAPVTHCKYCFESE